jgi:type II/III secretion system protein
VLIDDGGVVVLGGLIQNSNTRSGQRVPLLGSIPLIGNLFKTRQAEGKKNNLMIFIRPKILRDEQQAAWETDSKYNYMIDQQKQYNKPELDIPLLPGVKKPKLDPIPPPPPAPKSPASDDKFKQTKEQDDYDSKQLKKLQSQPPVQPGNAPPSGKQPDATAVPYGEPPYATDKPGAIIPQQPPPATPPEGSKQ